MKVVVAAQVAGVSILRCRLAEAQTLIQMKQAMLVALVVCFVGAQMLAPTLSLADVLRCTIDGYNEDFFITTSPDTNQNDGQYARIGISPGIGNRAIVFADRMGGSRIR